MILIATLLAACGVFAFSAAANDATAVTPVSKSHTATEEFSAQSYGVVRRSPRRVRIYGAPLSPNAVRVCNAYYVQEYRPSGTVIVPRMNCYWRG
jgi:hypothetical protein